MGLFCKHDWEILSEIKTESKIEQMLRLAGEAPYPRNNLDPASVLVLEPVLGKQLIQIVTCKKCGKLTRWVTQI